ncbi:hypothetical protein LA345_40615 (plasmid) [Burkholderia vietnamiensis]|uniref:Uncharacterized protein n=1 Tax=Burkholderia vietnamiensis (strain G4 / LMG 22486) TaxID=269482 RepID=A4JTZ1_BURVG|nr:hypothetical protein Bcep1808_6857 [Burkholderia vietnamiensis G4]MCB4350099.1 hypothetical protein [Burkholderia vietnamiensis]
MFEINIYGEPPSAEKIRQLKGSFDDSAAFTVFMMVPIPGVDILAGLATYAIEETVRGTDFWDADGAIDSDWSMSIITQRYVEKVRAQHRQLVRVEVDALKRHLAIELPAREAASAAASAVADVLIAKGKEAIGGAASDAMLKGLKGFFGK